MAAYTDLVTIKKYLPEVTILQLTDDDNVGSIVQEVIDEAILGAQTMVDAYMRGRYPAEIAEGSVPQLIKDLTTKIACYNLFRRKISLTIPEVIVDDYKSCLSILRDIQSGKVTPFPVTSEPVVIIGNRTDVDKDFSSDIWEMY